MLAKRIVTGLFVVAAVFIVVVSAAFLGAAVWLDDTRLTHYVNDLANDNFTGKVEIKRVHWALPLRLQVDDAVIKSPDGQPVMKIPSVDAAVLLLPIFTGRVVVDHVAIKSLHVDMILPPGGQTPALIQALRPEFELPPIEKLDTPVRIEVRNLFVSEATLTLSGKPQMQARITDLDVNDASLWLSHDQGGASLTVTAATWYRDKKTKVHIPNLTVKIIDARMRFSTFETWLKELSITLPGIGLAVSGSGKADETGISQGSMHGSLHVDTENPTLRQQVPTEQRKCLRGKATLDFAAQAQGATSSYTLDMHEERLEVCGMPIKELHVKANLEQSVLKLEAFRLGIVTGWLQARGHVTLQPSPEVLLGDHDISIKAHALPVRALAGQFVGMPALLPEGVSFAVTSKGRALWPLSSQVDLDVVPEGLPGEDWPGLPKSMELEGRFFTHPALLEIFRLNVNIDKVPSFGIQGALPMKSQSVIDLIEELHSPNPKGPLRRVPVAPTEKRPKPK